MTTHTIESYDEVPYVALPYARTHPDRLAAMASLFGLEPPDPRTARVLEIGCAAGANIAPMAWGKTLMPRSLIMLSLRPRKPVMRRKGRSMALPPTLKRVTSWVLKRMIGNTSSL